MKGKLIAMLVVIFSIAFLIALFAYDMYLTNQGLDKSARASKELAIVFYRSACSYLF